ncbi:MAG TPA: septum formation family protein [Acidothermales bacterium]
MLHHRRSSAARAGIAATVLSLLSLTLAACGSSGPDIQTGDCFARGTANSFDFDAKVSCDEPHTVEVVATAPASGELADFNRAELDVVGGEARRLYLAEVSNLCEPAWSAYTGYEELAATQAPGADVLPALYGDLAVEATPARQWDRGDRTLICYQVFGRPGFDGEEAVPVTSLLLADLLSKQADVPVDVRDCALRPTADVGERKVPCTEPHDREYLGNVDLAEFRDTAPGLDQAFLDAFDSRTAPPASWEILDGLCRDLFVPLLGTERPDITVYSQVYTADPAWGWKAAGAYHAACFAQTEVQLTSSLIGIGDAALPV